MRWILAEIDQTAVRRLSEETGLHPLVSSLLVNRGISDSAEAESFLSCDLSSLSDPAAFSQMDAAVSRIRKAIESHERIVVYGDYDVDGITGAALLFLALVELGADVDCYIPDRLSEGYGLNIAALSKLKNCNTSLVITVDCGISAFSEAEHARGLGLDLIITDHHQLVHESRFHIYGGDGRSDLPIPSAHAVLHPMILRDDLPRGVRDSLGVLTGVGVSFKLVQALFGAGPKDARLMKYLDLVALGTISDVGSITGENRVIVKHGLSALSSNGIRPGLMALKEVAGLSGRTMGVGNVGFALGPRINASGRLENARDAFRLLTTESQEEAMELARQLDSLNRERQSVEEAIREEARAMCSGFDIKKTGAFVLESRDWHPGVVGIVASRIAEEFYRPAALIAVQDGIGKGSARSIPGFDLYAGLALCRDLLLSFGGHTYAAGFTVAEDKIPELRSRLSDIVMSHLGEKGFVRTLCIDSSVNISELTPDLVKEIESLGPFGQGNPEPRLGSRGLDVLEARIVGKNHLRLRLRQADSVINAVGFGKAHFLQTKLRPGSRIAAVFTPRLNTWNGATSVELEIKDIKTEKW